MKNKKKEQQGELSNFNKVLYLFIVVIVFGFAFVVLVNKQHNSSLADINGSFNVRTEYNKRLVAQDMNTIYPKYYVAYFYDGMYEIHSFNYYNTVSQYDLEFNRLLSDIVDYNRKESMIRTYDLKGVGTYEYVKENFESIVGVNNLKIYE